jgi:putative FmdB family regulatory protein
LDLIQKVNASPEIICPDCGKPDLVRLVSAAGFQLKGTGWYATDFKTDANKKPANATSVPAVPVESVKPTVSEKSKD